MKIKPGTSSEPLDGRIDGVAYGSMPSGNVGRWWPYPTMSPTPAFDYSNGSIITTSLTYETLDDYQKTDWFDWVDELTTRELCELWHSMQSSRSQDDAAKAGYVNCNQWRMNLGIPPSTETPEVDLLPNADTLEIVSATPLVLRWNRPGPFIPFACYYALFVNIRNNAPPGPVQGQKMRWVTNVFSQVNEPFGITLDPISFLKGFKGCYAQLGVACGVPGSAPFMAQQAGIQY